MLLHVENPRAIVSLENSTKRKGSLVVPKICQNKGNAICEEKKAQ